MHPAFQIDGEAEKLSFKSFLLEFSVFGHFFKLFARIGKVKMALFEPIIRCIPKYDLYIHMSTELKNSVVCVYTVAAKSIAPLCNFT